MTSPDPRPTAVVLDIDGVLADIRHRLHHVEKRPRDWEAFFADAPGDPPLAEGVAAARTAAEQGHRIIYLTGRPQRCRPDTESWLALHDFPDGPLHMRRDDDRRPARMTKVQVLRRLTRSVRISVVIDDDDAVIEAVAAAGFPTLHATWMTDSTSTGGLPSGPEAAHVLFEVQEEEGRT